MARSHVQPEGTDPDYPPDFMMPKPFRAAMVTIARVWIVDCAHCDSQVTGQEFALSRDEADGAKARHIKEIHSG